MSAFDAARSIEARGMAILVPFLKEHAHDGQMVLTSKGKLARYLQEIVGDAMFNTDADTVWSVEVKVEEENKSGNLFLETWSNKNLDRKDNHARVGSNPGWLLKIRADLLFYYFLASDDLYVIDVYALQRWAFVHECGHPNIDDYEEKMQRKRGQLNDTWGRCVPITDLRSALGSGIHRVKARQVEMQFADAENVA